MERCRVYTINDYDGMGGMEKEFHCENCDNEISRDDRFCKHCGFELIKVVDTGFVMARDGKKF